MNELARLVWRVIDWFDYWVRLAELRVLDAVCGTEPEEDEADRHE
jgi:hypothetical protein